MTSRMYKKYTDKQFAGLKAVALRDLCSKVGCFKKGAIITIVRKYRGFEVESRDCPCCKISLYMTRVPYEDIDLLNPELLEVKE